MHYRHHYHRGKFLKLLQTLVRCKTIASLSQVVFSLFRTNANAEKAIALLNDKDTTNGRWNKLKFNMYTVL